MKNIFLIPLMLLFGIVFCASLPGSIAEKNTATVEQVDGYYIFMFSKPTAEYEVLGTVKKTGLVMNGYPQEMFNIILRKAKKDFPKCDAIIFTSVEMDKAECIKFK